MLSIKPANVSVKLDQKSVLKYKKSYAIKFV